VTTRTTDSGDDTDEGDDGVGVGLGLDANEDLTDFRAPKTPKALTARKAFIDLCGKYTKPTTIHDAQKTTEALTARKAFIELCGKYVKPTTRRSTDPLRSKATSTSEKSTLSTSRYVLHEDGESDSDDDDDDFSFWTKEGEEGRDYLKCPEGIILSKGFDEWMHHRPGPLQLWNAVPYQDYRDHAKHLVLDLPHVAPRYTKAMRYRKDEINNGVIPCQF
jgi:hypothetical protein